MSLLRLESINTQQGAFNLSVLDSDTYYLIERSEDFDPFSALSAHIVKFGTNFASFVNSLPITIEEWTTWFSAGEYTFLIQHSGTTEKQINYNFRRLKNGVLDYGANGNCADRNGDFKTYLFGAIDVENELGYFLECDGFSQSYYSKYRLSTWLVNRMFNGLSNHELYNILTSIMPVRYNYDPIAFIQSKYSHRNFSMIKSAFTNHGDTVENVTLDNFERIGTPNPTSKVNDIVSGLTVGGTRVVGFAGDNGIEITRDADTGAIRNFTFKYRFNGVLDSTLNHSISIDIGEEYFLSFLIDENNEAARPSIIKANTLAALPYSYNLETVTRTQQSRWFEWLGADYGKTIPTDPGAWSEEAKPATPGSTDPGAGDGANDKTTGNIVVPDTLPNVNAINTQFVTLWGPDLTEMKLLANYMWNTLDLSQWRRLFADPMDCILACYMYPLTNLQVRGQPTVPTAKVNVGNISTGIDMHLIEDQYLSFSFGSMHIDRQTNTYMDFSPYTQCSLFLPYIGIVAIDVDEIMGKDIELTYNIDLMTGTCLAMLTCETTDNSDVLYQWAGNCAIPIPLTSASFDSIIKNAISVVATTAVATCAVATGNVALGVADGALAASRAKGAMTGGVSGVAQSLSNVTNSKANVARSGSLGSNASFLGPQEAYLIWKFPNEWRAEGQAAIEGYPLYATETLSDLTGFTVIHDMHLEGMSCTQDEADEIISLLKEGVII